MIKELRICVNWVYDKIKYLAVFMIATLLLFGAYVVKEKHSYDQCIKSGLQSYDCDFD